MTPTKPQTLDEAATAHTKAATQLVNARRDLDNAKRDVKRAEQQLDIAETAEAATWQALCNRRSEVTPIASP